MARPIAKDHDEKRAQILNTAARVFAREGYDRASMNQVARAAGISKANIYHYYAGKEALLFGVLDSYLSDLRDRVLGSAPRDGTAEERLLQTIRAVLRAYHGADDHHRVQLSSLATLPEEQQDILRSYQRDMVRHLSAILADLASESLGRDAVRLRATTMSIYGMLNWYFMWSRGADLDAREDYARLVTDMVIGGIARL